MAPCVGEPPLILNFDMVGADGALRIDEHFDEAGSWRDKRNRDPWDSPATEAKSKLPGVVAIHRSLVAYQARRRVQIQQSVGAEVVAGDEIIAEEEAEKRRPE